MIFTSGMIIRLIRGILGLALVITGILYSNWVGIPGIFLLMSAIGGGCGMRSSGCSVKRDM